MKENQIYLEKLTNVAYPSKEQIFSPSENYPEYPFEDIANEKNDIYSGIRNLLFNMGLDKENYGTKNWNPLGELINQDDKVVIKPNFVMDYNEDKNSNIECLITNASIIRVVCDYLYIARKEKEFELIIADSPLQFAKFDKIITNSHLDIILNFYHQRDWTIPCKDLRLRKINKKGKSGVIQEISYNKNSNNHILVSMDNFSLHQNVKARLKNYRVTDYNPLAMYKQHNEHKHNYLISKDIIEADLIINIPKLKTHRKAGITCALKNLIGINGHKEYLPHHTKGSVIENGDEYLNKSLLKNRISTLNDKINLSSNVRKILFYKYQIKIYRKLIKLFGKDGYYEGSWFGNDTLWRTILDLNKILLYSDKKGDVQKYRNKKKILVLTDAVVSGEGEAPLSPISKNSGYLLMSFNSALNDIIVSKLMGFDFNKIPSVRNAVTTIEQPLIDFPLKDMIIKKNGKEILFNELEELDFIPTFGWKGFIENE